MFLPSIQGRMPTDSLKRHLQCVEGLGMCTMMLTATIMRMLKDKDQPNQQPKRQMGSGVIQLSILQQCKQMKPSSSCRRTGDSEYRSGESLRTREFKAPF